MTTEPGKLVPDRDSTALATSPELAAQLQHVQRLAYVFLSRFQDPARIADRPLMLAALKPQPTDCERVFTPQAAAVAKPLYDSLWLQLPAWPVRTDQTELRVFVAQGQDFATRHPRQQEFPGGYQSIASYLLPNVIWVCFEFAVPGSMGIAFDGLVWMDDRFAWFPKPYRALAELQNTVALYQD